MARTDGVPLFVEELTKTVLESGLLADAGDHYELSGPLPPLAIPTTLHDSLMARLDRLAPVKEVAQIGAVIGREFSTSCSPRSHRPRTSWAKPSISWSLGAGLPPRPPPEATYSFKHALVQEAAYQSLLKSKRQQLHAGIADALEQGSLASRARSTRPTPDGGGAHGQSRRVLAPGRQASDRALGQSRGRRPL